MTGVGGDDAPPGTKPTLRVLSFYEQGSHISSACYNDDRNEVIFEEAAVHNETDTERIMQGMLLENKVATDAPLSSQTASQHAMAMIPYQLLKSLAFEPQKCRTVIGSLLTYLRNMVFTLKRNFPSP